METLTPRKKGLNWSHGVLISDELFDAYLKCKTKAQLTFGLAGTDEPSHAISDWQRRLAENYEAECRDRLQSADNGACLVGSPRPEDLRSAKYRLIIQPYITAHGCRIQHSRDRTRSCTDPEAPQPLRPNKVRPT